MWIHQNANIGNALEEENSFIVQWIIQTLRRMKVTFKIRYIGQYMPLNLDLQHLTFWKFSSYATLAPHSCHNDIPVELSPVFRRQDVPNVFHPENAKIKQFNHFLKDELATLRILEILCKVTTQSGGDLVNYFGIYDSNPSNSLHFYADSSIIQHLHVQ